MNSKTKLTHILKATRVVAGLAALILTGIFSSAWGQTPVGDDTARIQQGFAIAPVPLNLAGLDQNLVGLGSYLVNAVADCNGCHSNGPATEFKPGGMPYFGQRPTINPATYLGGGRDFGAFPDPNGPFPHIISRNLTPDKTGLPEGGHTLQEFTQILRTGIDMDHLHPTCAGPPNGKCLPPPFNGDLLQIMPWPIQQNMTDHEIAAIYEYLRAIPCITGPTDPNDPLHNDCGPVVPPPPSPTLTIVINGVTSTTPTFQTVTNLIGLDASASTTPNAGASLKYLWTVAPGSPSASITDNDKSKVTIQLSSGKGTYIIQLKVTDSTGASSTANITIQFI